MPCYKPLQGFFNPQVLAVTGKRDIKITKGHRQGDTLVKNEFIEEMLVSCGQCVGCRLAKAKSWAIRCMHEASLYEKLRGNSFITLTFAPEHLPADGSLDIEVFQDFMKRLRKKFVPTAPKRLTPKQRKVFFFENGIRYYHCGEYGGQKGRPHYHACLFNCDFPDKTFWRKSDTGFPLYRSKILEELWPFGHSEIGSVTMESASYCARYILDKINGPWADYHYEGRKPEYTTMSLKPGIGRLWYEKHKKCVYPSDEIIMPNGLKVMPPKYYDSLYEIDNPDGFVHIKEKRVESSAKYASDNTLERLAVREKVRKAKISKLHRNKHKDPNLC